MLGNAGLAELRNAERNSLGYATLALSARARDFRMVVKKAWLNTTSL